MLRELKEKDRFYKQFGTWAEVIAFKRDVSFRHPKLDYILRPIFQARQRDSDPRWRTILFALFWDELEAISRFKSHWDPDPHERWANITWAFIRVVANMDVARRPFGLGTKVFNDTIHRLYRDYRGQWQLDKDEAPTEPEELERLAGCAQDPDFADVELRDEERACVRWLKKHRQCGLINEGEFLLILGTRIYGTSLVEYADYTGQSYEALKKRRRRAEAKIGGYRKNHKIF